MGLKLRSLLLIFLLMGSCCSHQTPIDLVLLTLETVVEQQNQILQKLDEQHGRSRSLEQCSTKDQIYGLLDLHVNDECAAAGTNNCSEMATCTDTFGHYKCICLPGYSGNGFNCEDIDECKERTDICDVDHMCVNFPGSYTCRCHEGYKKHGNSCQDINECEERYGNRHKCHNDATCTNTIGNYTCQCLPYYEGDGYTCNDINECEEDVLECHIHASCINNVGGNYTCRCFLGYDGDGYTTCVPDCKSPSHEIEGFGCIIPVKEYKSWDDAQDNCRRGGGRLLEGIQGTQHIDILNQHFYEYIGENWVHVGFRGGKWVTSRDPISLEDASRIDVISWSGKELCGKVFLESSLKLFDDAHCSRDTEQSLCQVFYAN